MTTIMQSMVERDPVYNWNARSLARRTCDGKITPQQAASIREWLLNAATRRVRHKLPATQCN